MPSSPDPIDPLLDRWAETPASSPPLAPEVWRRIALADTPVQPAGWADRIESWFASPPFATAFVVSCVLLGVLLAELRLLQQQRQSHAQLARNYLQLIDPLLQEQSAAKH
ncbi:MAG TPA: hypothetical protein VMI53_11330 [Opitutaceae bacterium]|nr:hypothetical protein [Opitutaceae bacterium]